MSTKNINNDCDKKLTWKDFLFCAVVILEILGLLYIYSGYDFLNILKIQELPIVFYIFAIILIVIDVILFYPIVKFYIKQGLTKYLVVESSKKETSSNSDLQKELKIDSSYEDKTPILSVIDKNGTNSSLSDSFDLLKKDKYELLIKKSTSEIDSAKKNNFSIFMSHVFRYFAIIYSQCDIYDEYLEQDIKFILRYEEKFAANNNSGKKNSDKKRKIHLFAVSCRANLVILYYKNKKYREMHKENKKLINIIIRDPGIDSELKYKSLQWRAFYHLENKNIPYAIGYFEEALKYTDKEFPTLYNIYLIYKYKLNDLNRCIEVLKRISCLDTLDNDECEVIANNLAYNLSLLGKYKEAYDCLDAYCVNQNNEVDIGTLSNKCYLAFKTNNNEEAKDLLGKIIKNTPSDATCLKIQSIYQIQQGEYDFAITNLSEAIKIFEREEKKLKNHFFTGEAYYYRAVAYIKKRELEKAHQDFEKATECGFYEFESKYIVDLDNSECISSEHEESIEGGTDNE